MWTFVDGSITQVVSIAQSSITFAQVDYGLGYPISMQTPHQLAKFEQASRW
jgi:hypothetical protein